MKNFEALNGIAYTALALALYVSGPAVQDQIDRLAANENLQLAKAMYQSVANEAAPLTATTVLAETNKAAPMQFDSAKISAPAASAKKCVKPAPPAPAMVPAPPRVEQVAFVMPQVGNVAGMSAVDAARLKAELEKANAKILASVGKSFEARRFVFRTKEMKGEKVRVEIQTL